MPFDWDFGNMNDWIYNNLAAFDSQQEHIVENMRAAFKNQYNPEKLVLHTYEWLTKLEGFETD